MKKIAIVGSTGSIGRQTLAVVEAMPGRFGVIAVAAGNNLEEVAGQVLRHGPELVSVASEEKAGELKERLRAGGRKDGKTEIVWGSEGMRRVATHPDVEMVVSAAVGVVGLAATYAAIEAGKQIALANKEVLVAAGEVVMAAVKRRGTVLLPVDSEHNAIHQCLRAGERREVARLVLTASGGPFRKRSREELANVTVEEALAHPNWKMGPRITIDSATLMNKGFEVIEAHWLFDMPGEKIAVVIHPQSTVHSMVEFVDGSIVAQLGPTDMRMPIQYALTFPERAASNGCSFDWGALRTLEFEKSTVDRFPCLMLAREAMKQGGAQPCALNAADEVAVAAFLEGRLGFLGIAEVIERVMKRIGKVKLKGIEDVLEADGEARELAREEVGRAAKGRSTGV